MLPNNDDSCGWLKSLANRAANAPLSENIQCDWLIIGAGYTGLSAARKLAELMPNDGITILDANGAGEGASARNSGYLVDSTLNDGHLSDAGLENYLSKYHLNKLGMDTVREFVNERNIDCQWNECGKYHATSLEQNDIKLQDFSQTLMQCGIAHDLVTKDELSSRLGTSFYRSAVYTHGGVMLQPAMLARGMIEQLPIGVRLYEQSPVTQWQKTNGCFEVSTPKGLIKAKHVLVCANGFMPSLNIERSHVFPLTLTASLTRPLTDLEYASIGSPTEWGVLSAQPMGATVRLTQDRRIMIRNTAEAFRRVNMNNGELEKRKRIHRKGLMRRFPSLPDNILESTWSGVTCISSNSANVFEDLGDGLFTAGCYNGGGIGLATLFGEQLAFKATGVNTQAIGAIESRPKPDWLPPQPFLRWGVKGRLMRDRWRAIAER
jgi:glycine/D-amino acid oxidase-like deaminating enzyme